MEINEDMDTDSFQSKVKSLFEKDYNDYTRRKGFIEKRAMELECMHEDLVLIEKLDQRAVQSMLALNPNDSRFRLKSSEIGRILSVSSIDSGDPIKEAKKSMFKKGDIVRFAGDASFCLNIWDAEEIWVLQVDSILYKDNKMDYDAMMKKVLKDKAELTVKSDIINTIKMRENAKREMDRLEKSRGKIITS